MFLREQESEHVTAIANATRAYIRKYKRQGANYEYKNNGVFWCKSGMSHYFHEQKVFCVKDDPNNEISNEHYEGAILRAYYEHLNINQFAALDWIDGGNDRRIVDVGASRRLINEPALVNMVALNPHASFGDYLREASTFGRVESRTYHETLGDFATYNDRVRPRVRGKSTTIQKSFDYDHTIRFHDLLNFTDSLYYIGDKEIHAAAQNMGYGVIACGTCHVPLPKGKTDGFLKVGDHCFGIVERISSGKMKMTVKGNPEPYYHDIKLQEAITHDIFTYYQAPDYDLIAQILDRFDFGATYYVRFCLVKVRKGESPQTEAETIYERKCKNATQACINDDIVETKVVKDVVNKDGVAFTATIKDDSESETLIDKSAFVAKVGDNAVCYTNINGTIVGQTLERVDEDGSWTSKLNPVNLIRTQVKRQVLTKEVRPDFMMSTDVYNKIVKEFMKVDVINRKSVKSAIFLAQMNLPSASMQRYLIPIVTSALREAFAVEARIQNLLDSETAKELQYLKDGEYSTKQSMSIWKRIALWMFVPEDFHQDF